MKQTFKKALALLLVAAMLCGMFVTTASAADTLTDGLIISEETAGGAPTEDAAPAEDAASDEEDIVTLAEDATGGAWDGTTVTEVTASEDVYEVSSAAQLARVAGQVNGGDSFSGKTVKLTADIDLNGKEWTPIGQATVAEDGTPSISLPRPPRS